MNNVGDVTEKEQTSSGEALSPEESEEAEANEPESESGDSEVVETGESGEDLGTTEIDFETELEKERKRLGQKIDKERNKRIELQKKFIPRDEAERLISEKIGEVEKRLIHERAEILAERLAKSPAEKELIMLHYDNSILPSGNLEEDIERAYAIANRKKIQGEISELKKAIVSKKTVSTGDSGAGIPPVPPKKPQKYSQEILEGAKFAGVSPEEFAKKLKT